MTRRAGRHAVLLSGSVTELEVTARLQVRVGPFAKDAAQQRSDFRWGRVRGLIESENTGGKN